jgi:hypothetical protein
MSGIVAECPVSVALLDAVQPRRFKFNQSIENFTV